MAKIPQLREASFFVDSRMKVAVVRQRAQGPMELHRHEFLEITVVLGGSGMYTTPFRRRPVRAGDVMVVNSSHSHGYEETDSLNIANILVREDLLREVEGDFGRLPGYHALFTLEPVRNRRRGEGGQLHLSMEGLRRLADWIESIEEESKRVEEGGPLLAKAWLTLMIGFLSRCYAEQSADSGELDVRLGRVLSEIDLHPEKAFTVREMAALAKMSERSFQRQFRAATGLTPIDYVIRARIRLAMRLLKEKRSDLNITEIALCCGFNDSNYFARQFRRITGQTPRGVREWGR